MSLLRRFLTVVNERANEVLDHFDDPGERLDYLHQQLREHLVTAQEAVRHVRDAAGHLSEESERLRERAGRLESEAKAAMDRADEDGARELLARRSVLVAGSDSIATERAELEEEVDRFEQAVDTLERSVSTFSGEKAVLRARAAASDDSAPLDAAVVRHEGELEQINEAVDRAEEIAAALRAQVRHLEALLASPALSDLDASPGPISDELAAARGSDEVERALEQLRSR